MLNFAKGGIRNRNLKRGIAHKEQGNANSYIQGIRRQHQLRTNWHQEAAQGILAMDTIRSETRNQKLIEQHS